MHELRSNLTKNKKAKIGLFVLDGVGGLPFPKLTELEAAKTPTLDKLAKKSETGVHIPILSGLTPGSGSAHLSLFGYDPLKYNIGRGILEGLGLDISVNEKDLLIRGNFSTVIEKNSKLIITDRRAGRISTAHNKRIVKLLQSKITKIDGIQVEFTSGLEHRFVCKLKFNHKLRGIETRVADTDPEEIGVAPLNPQNQNKESLKVSKTILKLISKMRTVLKNEKNANYALLSCLLYTSPSPRD